MKYHLETLFAGALICALGILVTAPVRAESHRISDPGRGGSTLEPECRPLMTRRHPCHVHRHETFERLPKNDPALMDEHARKEYLEFYRQRDRRRPSNKQ